MDASEYCVALYESKFGKGSWAKLEADVKSRHPEISWICDNDTDEEDWKPHFWYCAMWVWFAWGVCSALFLAWLIYLMFFK